MKTLIITSLVIFFCGCVAQSTIPTFPDPELKRAQVTPGTVYRAIEIENALNAKNGELLEAGAPWFEVIPGRIPVVITAPHATRPLRDGNRRFSDGGGTAALALAVAELTGAHVIYTTAEGPSDPNYYDDNGFKRALKQLVDEVEPKLVLDIHGSHPFRPYDVDLGTMGGTSLLGQENMQRQLVESLRHEGILNISDNFFAATKNQTITKFVAAYETPAIQFEVNTTYLSPAKGDIEAQRFSQLLQALVRFVDIVQRD
ncbi:hypothetical protein PVT68_12290 [Microbulbifer bruguierae]|uniref:Ketol-acid reductoisomerase n=1 Tax=Microbulbifer bruguierae TaxID=3029061 RepID=A0ABY8NAW8_9GAMM|nr:hypothetical protein [Microbulbifer bruguierae]WGL15549.1 hypothetical protein PVT68_12290 [Microbulbifer bruguierae]